MQPSRSSASAGFEISAREAPIRVVLAEDDHEFRAMLCRLLRKEGYEVVEARDGLQLIELVQSSVLRSEGQASVELIIADVRMPGATGLRALAELRRHDWNTPVVLISAFADAETRAEAARLGAVMFDKPFDMQELVWFVRQNTGNA
jgi:DNA-binding response OmpR family regulator